MQQSRPKQRNRNSQTRASGKREKIPINRKRAEAETSFLGGQWSFFAEMDRMLEDFIIPRLLARAQHRVCVEVPGIPKENLSIDVTPRGIEIKGEAKTEIEEEKEGFIRRERGYSKVHRSLTFPDEVLADKAEATLKNGVLEVRGPKKSLTEVKKHKVEIV